MNLRSRNLFLTLASSAFLPITQIAQADSQLEPYAGAPGWAETKEERTQWFKDAKFGMFIHWGLYTGSAGYWPPNGKKYPQHYAEWIRHWANVSEPEYGNLSKPLFTPDVGCTDKWAEIAKAAGMKYTVLTTKHHEGYTLFNSTAPYSVKNPITGSTNISPKGRDMVAEYADSVRKQGLKVGYYYSLIDWQHPDAYPLSRPWAIGKDAKHERYTEYMNHHIEELFTNYGKSDIVWVDYSSASFQGKTWDTKNLLTKVLKHQPQAITNNRFWNGLQNDKGDYFTPEKYIPATGYPGRTFEVCHTMNESFGYSAHDNKWKSTKEIVHMLVDIVSKGGNLLLNVGPDGKGLIPEESERVLRETGKWLETYGGAIYGTTASPFGKLNFNGRCTSKDLGNGKFNLYFHLLEWPADNKIMLPVLENKVLGLKLLGSDKKVKIDNTKQGWLVKLPAAAPNPHCSVVALQIEGEPKFSRLMSLVQQNGDRSFDINASYAKVTGQNIRVTPESMAIRFPYVSYWTDPAAKVNFSFNVHTPGRINPGGVVTHKPGRYAVVLEYAAANGSGGKLAMETVNDQSLTADLAATGGWNTYKKQKIGEITLTKAGETSIEFSAEKMKPSGFINIKSLQLKPLD